MTAPEAFAKSQQKPLTSGRRPDMRDSLRYLNLRRAPPTVSHTRRGVGPSAHLPSLRRQGSGFPRANRVFSGSCGGFSGRRSGPGRPPGVCGSLAAAGRGNAKRAGPASQAGVAPTPNPCQLDTRPDPLPFSIFSRTCTPPCRHRERSLAIQGRRAPRRPWIATSPSSAAPRDDGYVGRTRPGSYMFKQGLFTRKESSTDFCFSQYPTSNFRAAAQPAERGRVRFREQIGASPCRDRFFTPLPSPTSPPPAAPQRGLAG